MGTGKAGASGNPFSTLLAQAEAQAGRPASGEEIVCDECGTRAAMLPAVDVQLMSTAENLTAYVISGVGGLCRAGQHFICWKHMDFKNLDEGGGAIGRYVLACRAHDEPVEGITADAMERWRARGGPELMKASREDPAADWLRRMTADIAADGHEKQSPKRHWYQRRAKARS